MQKSKVLITGGAGFIGSNIADRLIKEGHKVVIVDNLSSGKVWNIPSEAKFYKADIREKDELSDIFNRERPEVVSHHAAQIDVRKSVSYPIFDLSVNGMGLLQVLENVKEYSVKKVIYPSSGGAIYGVPQSLPLDESHPVNPMAPYGVTKFLGEKYLSSYAQIYGINYTILRYGNVYGPKQDSHGEAGVVDIFTEAILRGDRPKIFGDGEQLRDYVFVGDVVEANVLALTKGEKEAINIGTGKGTSVNEVFEAIKIKTNYPGSAEYLPQRPGELQKVYLDNSKARRVLGWSPQFTFEEGVSKTVDWIKFERHKEVYTK